MKRVLLILLLTLFLAAPLQAETAILAETLYTMAGEPVKNGIVLISDGRIQAVGTEGEIEIPGNYQRHRAEVVTPGLIDAHTVVGLSGHLNQDHDQDQLDNSSPIQPHLRAIDAYNPRERLIGWVRSFGVTTIHTGHGPGNLVSGQTMIAKTWGETVDESVLVPASAVAATLGPSASESGKAPGTRAKAVAMLRAKLISAQEYLADLEDGEEGNEPPRNLEMEAFVRILRKEAPLLLTVHRAHDILTALRVAREFHIDLILDGCSEAYLVLEEIRESGFPVILHPTMMRSFGEKENLSMETASRLRQAGIEFAFQSGFEGYVPKTRVLLFEAALAAANGLSFDEALAAATIDAARILGLEDRLGSLEPGKDADLVLFSGDPFEYTTHVEGVFINGRKVSDGDSEWR